MADDWSWVPKRAWEWQEGAMLCGVHTHEGCLVWWSRPAAPGGYRFENGMEPSFADFLASGPPASPDVVDDIHALLRQHSAG